MTIHIIAVQLIIAAVLPLSARAATLDDLAWLTGCWRSEGDKRQITEHWMKPAGGNMLGVSHTVAEGRTREFEFMRIMQDANGDIFFVANPSGQRDARFKLTTSTKTEARFENPNHDFPQRIIYRREGDTLLGRIEGTSKGKDKSADFPLKRVSCD